MSIRRTRLAFEKDFTQIPNAWARDHRLSRKARGLLLEMMSHRIGWDISIEYLVGNGPEGRDAIGSGLRELEALGYLERERRRREDGTLGGVHYQLRDPWVDQPAQDYPAQANQPLKKTINPEDHLPEDERPKTTASGRRRMSHSQLTMLKDLVLMQELVGSIGAAGDPAAYVRSIVTTYAEADQLIGEYWQAIEHTGRAEVVYQVLRSDVYDRLSRRGRQFVDRENASAAAS